MRRRAIVLAGLLVVAAGTAAVVVHVRRTVVPPGCRDAQVLAIVRHALVARFHLPATVRLEAIRVRAGGPLAFRFVCTADLGGLRGADLPPGPRAGSVRYTTRLTGAARRLEVSVRVVPLLNWVPVQ